MTSHGTETGRRTERQTGGMVNRPTAPLPHAHVALAGVRAASMIMMLTMVAITLTLTLTFASTAFGADGSSDAGGHNEIYVEYSGGASYFGNESLVAEDLPGSTLTGRVNPDVGYHIGGAIGMRVHELIRTEIQVGFRSAEAGGLSLQGEPDRARGHYSLLTVMANAYVDYDFEIGVIPYAGVGVGWGLLDLNARNENRILGIDGDDTVFVWAVMLGGTVPISDSVDVSLGYRYIATTDAEFVSKVITTGAPGVPQSTRLDAEFDSHEAVLAIRYSF